MWYQAKNKWQNHYIFSQLECVQQGKYSIWSEHVLNNVVTNFTAKLVLLNRCMSDADCVAFKYLHRNCYKISHNGSLGSDVCIYGNNLYKKGENLEFFKLQFVCFRISPEIWIAPNFMFLFVFCCFHLFQFAVTEGNESYSFPVPFFHEDFEDLMDMELFNSPQQVTGKVQNTIWSLFQNGVHSPLGNKWMTLP